MLIPVPEVQEDSNFTLTVAGDSPYVNNDNEKDVNIQIELKEPLEKTVTYELELSGIIDGTGLMEPPFAMSITKTLDVEIPAHTTKVVIKDGKIDLSNTGFGSMPWADGIITGKLKDSTGKVVSEFTIEKHTSEIKSDGIADIKASRDNSLEASLSFTSYGDSRIVKMYYVYLPYGTSYTNQLDTIDENTKFVEVVNNKFSGKIAADLDPTKAYKVYYVLEDEFGSKTTVSNETFVIITENGEDVKQYSPVLNVTIPELSTGKLSDLNVSWTLQSKSENIYAPYSTSAEFTVTLYRDESPIATSVVKSANLGSTPTATELKLDTFAKELSKPGTYKVSVVVKGNNKYIASEPAYSNTVTVSQLTKVPGVTFTVDESGKKIVSWEGSEYEFSNIKGYDLVIVSVDEKGNETKVYQELINNAKTYDCSSRITAGKLYKAMVTVIAKDNQSAELNSELVSSKEFFYIDVAKAAVTSTAPGTATLTFNDPITVAGKEATYQVEVYEVSDMGGHDNYNGPVKTVPATLVKNDQGKYELQVTGLSDTKEYVFKVIANVDGIEGKSGYTLKTGILKEMPSLDNLVVSTKAGTNNIVKKDNNVLSIRGEDYDITKYPEELTKMYNLINATGGLHEEDTIVKFSDTTLTVKLGNRSATRTFASNDLAGMTVELIGDKNQRTIVTSSTTEQQPKEVILKNGNEEFALFVIDNLKAERIVLDNSVQVTTTSTTTPLVVAQGAKATINGFAVTSTTEETTIIPSATDTLTVKPNANSNNLTFDTTKALTINFSRVAGETTTQQKGTILVNSVGGNVTVTADASVNVMSEIYANVTDATLTLTNSELVGAKHVTVTTTKDNTAKVVGRFAGKLPQTSETQNPTFTALPLKEYKQLTDLTGLNKSTNVDATNFGAVKEFLTGFGLNKLETATVTISDTTNVTLDFAANTPATSVTGLE